MKVFFSVKALLPLLHTAARYGKCPWIIVANALYGSYGGQPSCALLINGEMFLVSDEILVSDRYRTGAILSAHLSVPCLADPNVSNHPRLLQKIQFAVWLSGEYWRFVWQMLTDRQTDLPKLYCTFTHTRRDAQFFQTGRKRLKIPCAKRVTWRNLHIEAPQILGASIQNLCTPALTLAKYWLEDKKPRWPLPSSLLPNSAWTNHTS